MASFWRCCRRCRLQPPTRITLRNRSITFAVFVLTLVLLFLLIPGSDVARYKYAEGEGKDVFLAKLQPLDPADSATESQHREQRSLKSKLILLWTKYFGSESWFVDDDYFRVCSKYTCEITGEKSRVGEADAVLFNLMDLASISQLPREHPTWQIWIVHNSMPPFHISVDPGQYNDIFNWTSSYRKDADIFSPLGGYVRVTQDYDRREHDHSEVQLDFNRSQIIDADQILPDDDPVPDAYALHDRLLFVTANGCKDPARQYIKVAQLSRFLPIDTYGDCGLLDCPLNDDECEDALARYQFALAFEDGYCRDYVTDRLWKAYARLQIPIVAGGANYANFAIPNSYIDYDNFSSAEELAEFVYRVSVDRDLYNSYFRWTRDFRVVKSPVVDWCEVCTRLHEKTMAPQVYKDFAGWLAQDSCPLFSKFQFFWGDVYHLLYRLFGI